VFRPAKIHWERAGPLRCGCDCHGAGATVTCIARAIHLENSP
jgi:hypothetical protein